MIKGGKDMQVMVLFIVSVVCLVAAVYIYTRKEDNDFARFAKGVNELKGEINSQKNKDVELEQALKELREAVIGLPKEFDRVREEFEAVQTHCAKLREGQIELRDRSYPRKVEMSFKHTGAIPIEIYTPKGVQVNVPKKKVEKAKTTKAVPRKKDAKHK